MTGISESELRFAPKQEMSRAQLAAILVRLLNETPVTGTEQLFEDVQADSWYYGYVMKAQKLGIIQGMSATNFSPDQSITREQMATMIARALQLEGSVVVNRFMDEEDMNQDLVPNIYAVQQHGLMEGYDGGFHPTEAVNREMAAVIAVRMQAMVSK
ncbi:Endo-1,4-beta-xylanase A precursor [compost metagenome]